MSTRTEREKNKRQHDKHLGILMELLREDQNKYCADCRAKGLWLRHVLKSIGLIQLQFLWFKIICPRTKMGLVESRYFCLYYLRWNSPKPWCTYFQSKVGEFGCLDPRANQSKIDFWSIFAAVPGKVNVPFIFFLSSYCQLLSERNDWIFTRPKPRNLKTCVVLMPTI